ncbi:hypothetical protein GCK32_017891, partial [Trichostrongylus colubriformis]
MVRSIKSKQSPDEQVVTLLSSMQMRVEHDEALRHRKSIREAKRKAQLLLADFKTKRVGKFVATRARSASFFNFRNRDETVRGFPAREMEDLIPQRTRSYNDALPTTKPPQRTRSYNGVLPSIVVDEEMILSGVEISSGPRSRYVREMRIRELNPAS